MKTETKNQIPTKVLARKDEIAANFVHLAEQHLADLMSGTAPKRFHASDFASRLFIHPRHLTTTLRLAINTSVCDYMEERILEEAQKLLKETNLPVAEIGQRFAYDEPTNFTKFFKSMTGITPLQYRKSAV
ncbi:helix-turn-helix domain-containing protein [Flavobacterium sp. Sd200]|uniref:helix-turn-helix domain-containing protein n=1 Tax=Flavobacterium sp. Sd200 TaxID=2692211 RepID=UPI0013694DFD|nr:helix-turn-helix transcriptional regulator [Flavobacterium sp. Sd200]MXN92793.1 helix-turn-helix domain-containing protein [Flavobacterium sp. Sd200]